MGTNRRVLKVLESRLKAHHIDAKIVQDSIKRLLDISKDSNSDPRTRSIAAKFIVQHDFDVLTYEYPPTQKQDLTHNIPTLKIEFVNSSKQETTDEHFT